VVQQKMTSRWVTGLSKVVKEVRLHFCQTNSNSNGLRNFVKTHYGEIKKHNPDLPVLIRECSQVKPRVVARYDFGVEKSVDVSGLDSQQIETQFESLLSYGRSLPYSQVQKPSFRS